MSSLTPWPSYGKCLWLLHTNICCSMKKFLELFCNSWREGVEWTFWVLWFLNKVRFLKNFMGLFSQSYMQGFSMKFKNLLKLSWGHSCISISATHLNASYVMVECRCKHVILGLQENKRDLFSGLNPDILGAACIKVSLITNSNHSKPCDHNITNCLWSLTDPNCINYICKSLMYICLLLQ